MSIAVIALLVACGGIAVAVRMRDGAGAVLLVYETNTRQPILVAIDRATGHRQWQTAPKKVNRMIGMAVSRTAVALSGSGLLQVFDLEHGRAMYVIGQ